MAQQPPSSHRREVVHLFRPSARRNYWQSNHLSSPGERTPDRLRPTVHARPRLHSLRRRPHTSRLLLCSHRRQRRSPHHHQRPYQPTPRSSTVRTHTGSGPNRNRDNAHTGNPQHSDRRNGSSRRRPATTLLPSRSRT